MSRSRALAAIALTVAISAGCCGTDFPVATMEARRLATPYDTMDYFRYALRMEDWSAVYDCLSAETRAFIDEKWLGRALFGRVFAGKELEDVDPHAPDAVRHMKVVDLIHRAQTLNVEVEPRDAKTGAPRKGVAIVWLYYEPYGHAEPFVLVEEDRWRVGIREWLLEREK
jgi:hypothetical protein